MFEIKKYRLHCSKCDEWSGYRIIDASDVCVSYDLEDDKYIFESVCPDCGGKIFNTRKR